MEKTFCFGLVMGLCTGALLAVNSYKFRKFVCESQNKVCESVEKMTEEKKEKQEQSEE